MSRTTSEIPFTELAERTQKLARVGENAIERVRGAINTVYTKEIPSKFDWNFLFASSSLVTDAKYTTGSVTLNTGDTAVTFSSDVVLTSSFTGRKIKFNDNDAVYDFTFANTTGGTISPSLQGSTNISAGAYTIFQPYYAIAFDFDRFPKDGGLNKWEGGRKVILKEEAYNRISRDYTPTPGIPEKIRIIGHDTAGRTLIELQPPPSDARNYGYDYLRRLLPMKETTAGFIHSISANATAVLVTSGSQLLEMNTGDFLRVDQLGTNNDSRWFPIIAIQNNTSLTLRTAFANTAITSSANFVVSSNPEMPPLLHSAIMYGAVRNLVTDQNDPNFAYYNMKMAEVLSDAKRIHVSRVYSQEVDLISEEYRYRY